MKERKKLRREKEGGGKEGKDQEWLQREHSESWTEGI